MFIDVSVELKRDRLLRKVHWRDFGLRIQFLWYVTPRHWAVSCLRSETTRLGIPDERNTRQHSCKKHKTRTEENCPLLGCYAAGSGNFLPTFRDHLPVLLAT